MATGMQPLQVDRAAPPFCFILPLTAATVIRDASVGFPVWSAFWLSSETWHWFRCSCVLGMIAIPFPQRISWHGILTDVTSLAPLWNALSSILTSHCLPAHLCLWNEEVFHMVSMTGKIIKKHSCNSVCRKGGEQASAINLLISAPGGGQQHQSVGQAPPKRSSKCVLIGHPS